MRHIAKGQISVLALTSLLAIILRDSQVMNLDIFFSFDGSQCKRWFNK